VYRGAEESGQEVFGMSGEPGIRASSMGGATATVWVSLVISAFVLAGYVAAARQRVTVVEWLVPLTLAMIVLVPALTFRYVLPLAPFVIFYFFCGLERARALAAGAVEWRFGAAFRTAAACILLLFAAEHAQYVWTARYGPQPLWLKEYSDIRTLTDWMREHLDSEGHVASNNPGLIFLATGRKGVSMGDARQRWTEWQRAGIRYGAAIQPAPQPATDLGFEVLYESADRNRWVIALQPGLTESDRGK
jgi:hypothetical protein